MTHKGNKSYTDKLGVYIHLPYCVHKCPYCDFNSYGVGGGDIRALEAQYLQALLTELRTRSQGAMAPLGSVFFGGGTPSLFSADAICKLLDELKANFTLDSDVEITLEANPGTLKEQLGEEKLRGFIAAGVNRISFGAQSFYQEKLNRLGRIHEVDDIVTAFNAAKSVGFENISLDLIYGIDGEQLGDWERDLALAVALKPRHISAYCLTVEQGTEFFSRNARGERVTVGLERQADMFLQTQQQLTEAGYSQYEVSNFARDQAICRHNVHYWKRGAYLGFGAGAHSFFQQGWGKRSWNIRSVEGYCKRLYQQQLPEAGFEVLDRSQALLELIWLGLRTSEGICLSVLEQTFGIASQSLRRSLLERAAEAFKCEEGRLVLDGRALVQLDNYVMLVTEICEKEALRHALASRTEPLERGSN